MFAVFFVGIIMRQKGDVLENFVVDTWPTTVVKTANSGAKYADNDIITDVHSIECKRKLSQESVSLTAKEIKQCKKRAQQRSKEPCWVVESKLGHFVVVDYHDYCAMLELLYSLNG